MASPPIRYHIGPIHREHIFDTPLKRIQDDSEFDRFDQLLFRIERLEHDFRRFIARSEQRITALEDLSFVRQSLLAGFGQQQPADIPKIFTVSHPNSGRRQPKGRKYSMTTRVWKLARNSTWLKLWLYATQGRGYRLLSVS